MSSRPRYTALAESLPATVPFVGPESQERGRGRPFRARLGANENVFGPSPQAIAAMARAAAETWMYGDPENHDLCTALAAQHRVTPANIAVGEGLVALPSAANFVAIDCGGDGTLASRVLEALTARDIFLRKPFVAPGDRCIRVSAGTPEMLDLLERALPDALSAARLRMRRDVASD